MHPKWWLCHHLPQHIANNYNERQKCWETLLWNSILWVSWKLFPFFHPKQSYGDVSISKTAEATTLTQHWIFHLGAGQGVGQRINIRFKWNRRRGYHFLKLSTFATHQCSFISTTKLTSVQTNQYYHSCSA